MNKNAIRTSGQTPSNNGTHAKWCDPEAHARAIREAGPDGHPECVGRELAASTDQQSRLYGSWIQKPGESGPAFSMEWAPERRMSKQWDLGLPELKLVQEILLATNRQGIDNILTLVGDAIDDHERGVGADSGPEGEL